MGTRETLLASVVMLLALADSGQAQQPGADPKQGPRNVIGAELVAINQCVRQVRAAHPGSEFDAHVGTLGPIRYVGTEAEIAAFRRCMQAKGFSVDPK
jgi:hypothetical protein